MRWIVFFCLIFRGATAAAGAVQEGDLLFQTSRSSQAQAIALATNSTYTHMGIFTVRNGKPYVVEAVQPVKITPYDTWVKRGIDKKVTVRRLKDPSVLTAEVIATMQALEDGFTGRNYDLAFAWDDDRLYCSELVYKVYDRGAGIQLGQLQKLRDFNLAHPVVQKKLHERYGKDVPLDMEVISPQAMFDDPRLVTVPQ